eukprot:CAMPEP_0171567228 /NCGR_PEP_ID=MMETSP0961-20121227/1040_1 /TAXON_ID=87120 /ORGANISM="Aurantiochytrium limacinum, Strain ATCCMYA-1381" /LENGTH=364 /DNA_ID=CAMNT_0012121119 /DNA_START=101 /DNA_END=1196 /DNA_ORIENTATION=-
MEKKMMAMSWKLQDAHVHLYEPHQANKDPFQALPRDLVPDGEVLNGTAPDDWDDVISAAHAHPGHVHGGIGIHPWRLHEFQENWLVELEDKLIAHPYLHVGEIGLDGAWKPPAPAIKEQPHNDKNLMTFFTDLQQRVFKHQFQLAVYTLCKIISILNRLHNTMRTEKRQASYADPFAFVVGQCREPKPAFINSKLAPIIRIGTSAHVNARSLFRFTLESNSCCDPSQEVKNKFQENPTMRIVAITWRLQDGAKISDLWDLQNPPQWYQPSSGKITTTPWREDAPKAWQKFCQRLNRSRGRLAIETDMSGRSCPDKRAAYLALGQQIAYDAFSVSLMEDISAAHTLNANDLFASYCINSVEPQPL